MKMKRHFLFLLAIALMPMPMPVHLHAQSHPQMEAPGHDGSTTFRNPVLWADVPDPDVIRVGSDFYLVSTTMHLMPGAPIMHSKDLVNWRTVNYIFDKLTDSPKYNMIGGTVYGRGQWATSLKYHKGKYYALFAPNDNPGGDTYIYETDHPEKPWKLVSRLRHFHDASLFFDDDDRVYVIYGTGQMCELEPDFSGVKPGSDVKLFQRDSTETGLLEGSRMIKHDGRYYLLMISWPNGKPRHQVCFRADHINGPYEKKTILETTFGGFPYVGQGTIVDAADGRWYSIIFQDRGGVGRVLTLEPCRWIDGWPMLGDKDGKIPEVMEKPVPGYTGGAIVTSDDFSGRQMSKDWEWNHQPKDSLWSLAKRHGWLRLTTGRVVGNMFVAPNTLSQRTEGPSCSGVIKMDVSKMKDGDVAGFSAFQSDAALVSVREIDGKRFVVATTESVELDGKDKKVTSVNTKELQRIPFKGNVVYFRIDADFNPGKDLATLYYSLDGKQWTAVIRDFRMVYDFRRFFMGTRFAIVYYATRHTGGYVDVDYFRYKRG
jgi:beta-xylosidase